ncbi:MAG TPA: hypothetical protein VE959_11735 [Bryobacteraceae bacterium]|nr:hypothetical protein [Bryobacteraceae bacterium]
MGQPPAREQLKEYARRWTELAPLLQEIRDRETRQADTASSIRMMEQAFRIALRDLPPRESSGLVEWQRYMALWRQRG